MALTRPLVPLVILTLLPLPSPAATPFGPSPYLSFNDSPFSSTTYHYFHLETFQDGLLNTPGASIVGNPTFIITGPAPFSDSVDADDGAINNLGNAGGSVFSTSGGTGITVNFNPAPLGGILPSDVGIVWTDGAARQQTVSFTAFDVSLSPIGTLTVATGDNNFAGGTSEDRFFGIRHLPGIARILITSGPESGIEADHLQYGRLPFLLSDFNFDNSINAADLTILNNGFSKSLTGYHNGDISLNGPITHDDYPLFDRALALSTLPPTSPSTLPLPETSTLLSTVTLPLLLPRRRRKPEPKIPAPIL